ncbi:hypothetical protein GCM10023093_15160 [Nemorincola caseinilytica]|uniref:Uncharacterized protein n=1 Tax=Nemorincola caseinilytica TaxID=2054315 RepID=A0ABP8NBP7_9BACT
MRYLRISISFLLLAAIVALSCKKWVDPAPVDDPRITNPYCNDPEAVNYNWGFPGKPDNTVCFYPSDVFAGRYKVHDTVSKDDLFISADSMMMTIVKLSNRDIRLEGLCPSGTALLATAGAQYNATLDTTVGDSLTLYPGQFFCRHQDTVTGVLYRDKVDSSLMYMEFSVRSDTGTTRHKARAIKQR